MDGILTSYTTAYFVGCAIGGFIGSSISIVLRRKQVEKWRILAMNMMQTNVEGVVLIVRLNEQLSAAQKQLKEMGATDERSE